MPKYFRGLIRGGTYLFLFLGCIGIIGLNPPRRQVPGVEARFAFSTRFERLYEDVATQLITPDSARVVFKKLFTDIRYAYNAGSGCGTIDDSTYFVYPLRGYHPAGSVGGGGKGYRPKGFDLFDMKVRGSHPAHDLFIKDRNRDNIDDLICQQVDVLAFTHGMVMNVKSDWTSDTLRRGGNFVWIYDPCLDGLFYYAHNSCISVEPGEWVEAGQKIAQVGRTGFNASKDRSPTHLHLMFLKLNEEALPEPYDTYAWLKASTVRAWADADR